jgi:hypothetical protein
MVTKITATMNRVDHKGRSILLADYANLRGQELVQRIQENEDAILKMGVSGQRNLLILTDASSATVGTDAVAALKHVAKTMKPYTCASAVVGITAARKFLLQTVNAFSSLPTTPHETVDQAKDWLVGQTPRTER